MKLRLEVEELRRLIRELAANVVTDVRLGGKETTDIWHGMKNTNSNEYI